MITARDDILKRSKQRARAAGDHPPAWRSRRQFDDLSRRFVDSLAAVHGEACVVPSLEAAFARLGDLLAEIGAGRVVVNDEPPFSGVDMAARWPDIEWHVAGRSAGDLRAFCAAADVGLSSADAALAETGTLVVTSGPGRSRLVTLLVSVHIALVPVSRLTADLFTWTAGRSTPPPAMITLISGPSKTADIEQVMAIGVHGPKRFIVILYGDED
ncbi:MAG: lactate utilization protein [Anaerolineae bacterium]|nr:lactate utilization protein [Anaerolineae bacterium]